MVTSCAVSTINLQHDDEMGEGNTEFAPNLNGRVITVEEAVFERDSDDIFRIRRQVFIVQQHVAEDLEIDGLDPICIHVLAKLDGKAVGTARMQRDGHIGRVSVVDCARRLGVGSLLVHEIMNAGERHGISKKRMHLGGQLHAIPFYRRLGFMEEGDVFLDADIEHKMMRYVG